MYFSVLILLIAIILFGVLAFRQMSALILAPVVTIFVIVLSGLAHSGYPAAALHACHIGLYHEVFSDFLCRRALWCSLSVHRGGGIHRTHHGTLLRQSFCRSHDYVYHRSFDLRRCERLCCVLRGLSHCFADVQARQSDTPPDSCGNFGRLLDMVHDSTRLSLHSKHHRYEKLRHNCNGSLPPLPDCYRRRVPDDFRLAGMQSQKIYGAGQAL